VTLGRAFRGLLKPHTIRQLQYPADMPCHSPRHLGQLREIARPLAGLQPYHQSQQMPGVLGPALSDRSIYGIAAITLLSPVNVGQVLDGVRVTYSSVSGDIRVWLDNDWWGRADDFATITAMDRNRIGQTLDFSNVMLVRTS
jgi:hypothetical protein